MTSSVPQTETSRSNLRFEELLPAVRLLGKWRITRETVRRWEHAVDPDSTLKAFCEVYDELESLAVQKELLE